MLVGENTNPRTDRERVVVMTFVAMGASMMAYLFGQVTLLVANYDRVVTLMLYYVIYYTILCYSILTLLCYTILYYAAPYYTIL